MGSVVAAARVRGLHYVAHVAAEGGCDYNTVDISEQLLREVYPPGMRLANISDDSGQQYGPAVLD